MEERMAHHHPTEYIAMLIVHIIPDDFVTDVAHQTHALVGEIGEGSVGLLFLFPLLSSH